MLKINRYYNVATGTTDYESLWKYVYEGDFDFRVENGKLVLDKQYAAVQNFVEAYGEEFRKLAEENSKKFPKLAEENSKNRALVEVCLTRAINKLSREEQQMFSIEENFGETGLIEGFYMTFGPYLTDGANIYIKENFNRR